MMGVQSTVSSRCFGGMTEASQRVDKADVMFRIEYVSKDGIGGSHTSAQVQGKFKCRLLKQVTLHYEVCHHSNSRNRFCRRNEQTRGRMLCRVELVNS